MCYAVCVRERRNTFSCDSLSFRGIVFDVCVELCVAAFDNFRRGHTEMFMLLWVPKELFKVLYLASTWLMF